MTYEAYRNGFETSDPIVDHLIEMNFNLRVEVARRYGPGIAGLDNAGSEANLAYHNLAHTRQAVAAVRQMADALHIGEYDTLIAEAAATAHDLVQLKARGVMERESADLVAYAMQSYGLEATEIEIARLAVLGTEPIMDGPRIIDQQVNRQSYPSKRAATIAQVVACADFAGMYSVCGPYMAHRLYQEIEGVPFAELPALENLASFEQATIDLARDYRFPHAIGEELYGGSRPAIISYHAAVLRRAQAGLVGNWRHLLAEDEIFADYLEAKGVTRL